MTQLSDEDRAAIALIQNPGGDYFDDAYDEALVIAGIRIGLERASKVCEATALQIGDKYYWTSSKECAAAIRALAKD